MNTVKKWMRATCALGFALVVMTEPASATAVAESLIATPAFSASHTTTCDAAGSASVIAFSQTSASSPQCCASAQAEQHDGAASGQQKHRFAEPASTSFWYPPVDSRRYSF